ncbi:Wadjet anti-phage system protein JetA family protein [Novosphingobium sp. BW1]|uniref:Wadjet anti-phage system protein JetA family protein n=1 Tax=Novosphingobium sp. BW1 TaxID=2592621 RepID=UPI001F087731|nr:Wadjet anti-phage system protein JetA family protein [Novosphingobium sp. BW1]
MQTESNEHREKGTRDALFGHLPPSLFAVLASPARRDYARLILWVYRAFFGEHYTNPVRKDDLVAFIATQIDRLSDIADDFASDAANADASQNPLKVYLKLRQAGWLVEHSRGYVEMVDLDASVSMLLETLSAIEEGEAVHFGGTIAALESVIERLGDDPFDKASSLADAALRARRFQQHLSAIIGNLRAHEQRIVADPQPTQILARFFDFVEDVLIADYRVIKTTNNPFRHRNRIIQMISDYEHDAEVVAAFAQGYQAQGLATNPETATSRVRQHLDQVKRIFDAAEERLDDIDAFRSRLEQRIARTVSYMNEIDGSSLLRVTHLLRDASALPLEWDDAVEVPSELTDPVRHWGPDSLAAPTPRRIVAPPSPVRTSSIDPAMVAYDHSQKAYLLRLAVTPQKIADYVERNLGKRDALDAEAFGIETPEEALLLQGARQLDMYASRDLSRRFRVVHDPGRVVETDWSAFTAFRIERLSPEPASNEQ